MSYHNLRDLRKPEAAKSASKQFDMWLQQTLLHENPFQRSGHLMRWSDAPAARLAHSEEHHLLPLMVAVGAAENENADLIYHQNDFFGHTTVSSFRFGEILKN